MRGLPRQIVVVLAVAVNLVLNGLAGAGLLFGVQTGAVSAGVPTGVTPAGWTFGIWTVIFLMLLVYAGFQAMPARRGARYDAPAVPFALANVLNGLWQLPWLTRHFGVSLAVIAGILGCLVWLYVVQDRMRLRENELWAMHLPGAYFLAWVAVATALNATIWLRTLGLAGPEAVWAPAVVLGLGAVGAWLLSRTGDTAIAAVLLWAFAGIYAAHAGTVPTVVALAVAAAAVVAAAVTGAIRRAELRPSRAAR
ncbi:MAG TPA: TspO/MBR family protein [Rubricoccaceae bacterium]|jgi:tryptophan-rich sensory protein